MKAIKKMLFFLIKILADVKKHSIFVALYHAKVAQLVERQPSKLNVASSNLVSRSKLSSIFIGFKVKLSIPNNGGVAGVAQG